jgi:4-aminobutyrate aminotransferase/(S)-3-amino-2-methylpropionate transaminase
VTTSPTTAGDSIPQSRHLGGAVPGPNSAALAERRAKAVARGVGTMTPVYAAAASGAVMNEPYVAVAEALNRLTPGDHDKRTLLLSSGAEATENVVKIARNATGRQGVVVFDNAFHGRTLLALAMTGKHSPYKDGYHPFPSEVHRVPYAYCYRAVLDEGLDILDRALAGADAAG